MTAAHYTLPTSNVIIVAMISDPNQLLFESALSDIAAAYGVLGHQLGWRFLNVSRTALGRSNGIVFLTINPGGNSIPPDHPWESCDTGSSYLVERWDNYAVGGSPLQIQVQALFRALATGTHFSGGGNQLLEQSLISQFIPFRSPDYASLPRKRESLEFAHSLWAKILPSVSPKLVICLGRDVQHELRRLIPSALGGRIVRTMSYPTGWGAYTADIDYFDRSGGPVRLLYLPHLSRYALFTRRQCAEHLSSIIHAATQEI
jgi:hypothetical protein